MKYLWHNGQWVPAVRSYKPRVGPYIITDTMPALMNHADGRLYDSKSAFRAATKAAGLVEIGNDVPTAPAPRERIGGLEQDVARAYEMVEQGYQTPPLDTISSGDFADVDTRVFSE